MTKAEAHGKNGSNLALNRSWLREQMNPYYFISMKDEPLANAILERELGTLGDNRRLILADREKALIMAVANHPGSLYHTLRRVDEHEISYAVITHSAGPLPGLDQTLEIQRFEFDRKSNQEIMAGQEVVVPAGIRRRIRSELHRNFPAFDMNDFDRLLRILWLNNENYVRVSPAPRVAQILLLLQRGNRNNGFRPPRQIPHPLRFVLWRSCPECELPLRAPGLLYPEYPWARRKCRRCRCRP